MEQLTKTRFQNVVVNKRLRIGDDTFDPEEPSLLYVAGDMKVTGAMGFNSNVNIDNDLVINGSLTVRGNSTIIESTNHIIHDNTIILNAGLQDLDTDFERETGIVIQRPVKNGFPQEPFKIAYKDVTIGDIDHNNILDIGISGDLHRVATINDYPINRGVPMWNDVSNILDTETNVFIEKHSIGGNSSENSQNLHVRNGTIFNTGRDGQHYDIDVLYQPPPKFANDGSELTTTFFQVKWRLNHVVKRLAFLNVDVPFIDKIGIDIKRTHPNETEWIEVTREHPRDVYFYNFMFNQSIGNIVISSDTSYNARVYGLNYVEQTTDNYLLFENLSLKNAGVPSEPTSIQFENSTLNSLTLKFTTPNDNDDLEEGNQEFPAIKEYEYRYIRLEENSDRNVVYPEEEYTKIYTVPIQDKVLSKEISFNITENVFPGTEYKLITLRAKNEVSSEASGYGPDGVGSSIITRKTLTPNTNAYFIEVLPDGSKPLENKIDFKLPNNNTLYNRTYYNTNSGGFTIPNIVSSFFVNNGRIGKSARNTSELVTIELIYENLQIYTISAKYNGYPNQSTLNGTTNTTSNDYFEFTDVSCADAKKEELGDEYSGFGLYGTYKIVPKTLPINDNLHTLTLRVTNYGGINALSDIEISLQNTSTFELWTHQFVIDDLTGPATIANQNASAVVVDSLYCHGIPSIRTMNVTVGYALSNYAKSVLPADNIVSKINASTVINGITSRNITTTTNDATLTVSEVFNTCSFNTNTNTELIDTITIPNVVELTPINFLGIGSNVFANLTDTKQLFVDVKSYTSVSNRINSVKSVGTNVYTFNGNNLPVLYSNTNPISTTQLLYINGAFTNATNYYKDYSGYKVVGPNYSNLSGTGTNVNGTNYKWVIKKYTSSYVDGDFKELILTVDGNQNRIADLLTKNIIVFVKQQDVNGQINSAWLNLLSEFNANIDSLDIENAGNRVQFNANYYGVFKGRINVTFDFYVRIGLPVGGTVYSISDIQFTTAVL